MSLRRALDALKLRVFFTQHQLCVGSRLELRCRFPPSSAPRFLRFPQQFGQPRKGHSRPMSPCARSAPGAPNFRGAGQCRGRGVRGEGGGSPSPPGERKSGFPPGETQNWVLRHRPLSCHGARRDARRFQDLKVSRLAGPEEKGTLKP